MAETEELYDGQPIASDIIEDGETPPWLVDDQVAEEPVEEEQSKGGWFANSWLGRQFGLDDKSQEEKRAKEAAEMANTGQENSEKGGWFANSWLGRQFGLDDASRAEKQQAEMANAEQESGGLWSWMRNSMVGRWFGLDDASRAEKQQAEMANAGQESGGLWSWMRNSMVGRWFGLDDKSREQKQAPMIDATNIETPAKMAQAPVQEQPTASRQAARGRSAANSDSTKRPNLVKREVKSNKLKKREVDERLTLDNASEKLPISPGASSLTSVDVMDSQRPLTMGGASVVPPPNLPNISDSLLPRESSLTSVDVMDPQRPVTMMGGNLLGALDMNATRLPSGDGKPNESNILKHPLDQSNGY